jgi:hypothetical protein
VNYVPLKGCFSVFIPMISGKEFKKVLMSKKEGFMKRALIIIAVFSAAVLQSVYAEERFGITVYPGAKYDEATSKSLKEMMQINAACFRTNDKVEKVVAFYKKHKDLALFGDATAEGALFQSKKNIDVTIQSPWMNMKTGTMMKDTLISIVNKAGQ